MLDEQEQLSPYITVKVLRVNHAEIKKYLQEIGNGDDIGKFYDKAGLEKLKTLKDRNSLWGRFNTQTLLSNGFKKIGSSSYQRGEDVVNYTGVYWYYNDILMNENNYEKLIYDKTKATFNPSLPKITPEEKERLKNPDAK